VNTLSNIYPGGQPELYPERSAVQAANHPMPVRFANIDHILAAAQSTGEIPSAIQQISLVLRERHRIGPGEADDFRIRDMTEINQSSLLHDYPDGPISCVVANDVAGGWRRWGS